MAFLFSTAIETYLPDTRSREQDFACTRRAVMETASRGLTTGGHIIIGLPLDYLKFHQLQILKGTPMASEYKERPGDFSATMSLSGGSPSGWRK